MTDNEYYAQAKSQDDVKAASLMGLRLFERRTVSTRNRDSAVDSLPAEPQGKPHSYSVRPND